MKPSLLWFFALLCLMVWGTSAPVSAQTYNIYFGDIHAHTWYSDGNQDQNPSTYTKPVARAITYARDIANDMDFLGISDHNHVDGGFPMTLTLWRSGFQEVDSVSQNGVFAGLYGQEWGTLATGGGHSLIYGTDKLFGWNPGIYDVFVTKNDMAMLIDSVKKYNGFIYLAHPGTSDYDGLFTNAYNALWDSVIVGVAIKSGPASSTNTTETDPHTGSYIDRYHDLLKKGYHVAPCGNQDNHNTNFGRSNQQRTGVLATSLTQANVTDALRNRRAYATEDHNIQLRLEVGTHQMGEIFTTSAPIPFRVKVVDAGESFSTIQIRYGIPGSGTAPTTLTSVSSVDSLIFSHSQPNNTTYYYYAYVQEADGNEAWSAPMWITTTSASPPAAFNQTSPSNSATNQAISGTLSWQTSTGATQYDVYLDQNANPTTLVSSNQAGTSYNYSGLQNNATYYWKIVAENASGNVTATGAPWSFTTIVASPSAFALTSPSNSSTGQAVSGTLSWQTSTNAAQYDVYLDQSSNPTTIVSANQAGTSYNYSGLSNNALYRWKVVAKNVAGNVTSTSAPWNFTTIVAGPGNFAQTTPSGNATNQPLAGSLRWNVSPNAATYDVYLDTVDPPALKSVDVVDTFYNFSSLLTSQQYFWKIIAKNAAGNVTASNAVLSFTTGSLPMAATDAAFTSKGAATLELSWQDNANDETGYRVYRASSVGGPYSQVGSDLPADATSFIDNGLAVNTRYYYHIAAFNGIGEATSLSANSATLAAIPDAPTISSITNQTFRVNIALNGNPATTEVGIRIDRAGNTNYVQANGSLDVSIVWQLASAWGAGNSVVVTGLDTCTEYNIAVIARNLDGIETGYGLSATTSTSCYAASLAVQAGWNLVSLPVDRADLTATEVFPDATSKLYQYNHGYQERDTVEPGKGYWIKYGDASIVNFDGTPTNSDTFNLQQGWNLVGALAQPTLVSTIIEEPSNLVVSSYFGYDNGYSIADSLLPAHGYWVKAGSAGQLILQSASSQTALVPFAKFKAMPESDEALAILRFIKETGKEIRLYIFESGKSGKSVNGRSFELPPVPPGSTFDVRFSSGRFAEFLPSGSSMRGRSEFPIDIRSDGLPVTLEWERSSSEKGLDVSIELNGKTYLVNGRGSITVPSAERTDANVIVSPRVSAQRPTQFVLGPNYPNPFNPSTEIRYEIPEASMVRISVYNLLGNLVGTIVDGRSEAGSFKVHWTPDVLPAGVYICRMEATPLSDNSSVVRQVQRMLYLK